MGISVVKLSRNAEGEDGTILAKDEIFGPVLPIIPVDDVDAAVRYVNARPTPLALYVCSSNRAIFDQGGFDRVGAS
jgi:acyl-CoA reductase-like NAD-dependent aldehyde dehydrogenase